MKKIFLIHTPFKKIILRDMYSSTISKGSYNWPNVDLLVISGFLKKNFEIKIIDANTLKLNFDQTISLIKKENPFGIVCSVGASARKNDYNFIRELRKNFPNTKIVGVGGVLYHNPIQELKNLKELDACLLNFVTNDLSNYFLENYENLSNVVYRKNDQIINTPISYPEHGYKYPVPNHQDLPIEKYKLSHGKNFPITSVLTSFGCPAKCSFCVSGRINFRFRDPENVIEELDFLNKMGVKEIIFRDNVFLSANKQARVLLQKMYEKKYKFSWVAEMRADTISEELAIMMQKTNCHAVHIGVESANQDTLDDYNKYTTLKNYMDIVKLLKRYGVKVLGYFIIGLPGENRNDVIKTINWAVKLDMDYASFNAPLPIYGTDLRDNAIKNGWINEQDDNYYDGSMPTRISTDQLSPSEIKELRSLAYRKFYLRPYYFFKAIVRLRTIFQIKMLLSEGINFFKNRYSN